jgi:hypothetical protein
MSKIEEVNLLRARSGDEGVLTQVRVKGRGTCLLSADDQEVRQLAAIAIEAPCGTGDRPASPPDDTSPPLGSPCSHLG